MSLQACWPIAKLAATCPTPVRDRVAGHVSRRAGGPVLVVSLLLVPLLGCGDAGETGAEPAGGAETGGEDARHGSPSNRTGAATAADDLNAKGKQYAEGRGVRQDFTEAAKLYRQAADLGHADAMANLGYLYYTGRGVDQDRPEAARWYRKAAELGSGRGMFHVGEMYEFGIEVDADVETALGWYRKSADAGDPKGMHRLGFLYEYGGKVKQDFGEAIRWYERAIGIGDAGSMIRLGGMYENGSGVARDFEKAVGLYRKAADGGDADGVYHLAMVYLEGKGVKQDDAKGMTLLRKAAKLGNWKARRLLEELESKRSGRTPSEPAPAARIGVATHRTARWDQIVLAAHLDKLSIKTGPRKADGKFIGVAADDDQNTIVVLAVGNSKDDITELRIVLRVKEGDDGVATRRVRQAGLIHRATVLQSDGENDVDRLIVQFLKDGRRIGPVERDGWATTIGGFEGSGYIDGTPHLGTPVIIQLERKR